MMTSATADPHRDFDFRSHRGPAINARPESELRFLKSGPVHTVAGLCSGMDVKFVIPALPRFEASFSKSRLRLKVTGSRCYAIPPCIAGAVRR
jgi:hypothetical protein